MFNRSSLAPLGVGKRTYNLSEGVKAPSHVLPVIINVDEYQKLMSTPVNHGSIRQDAEVVL